MGIRAEIGLPLPTIRRAVSFRQAHVHHETEKGPPRGRAVTRTKLIARIPTEKRSETLETN